MLRPFGVNSNLAACGRQARAILMAVAIALVLAPALAVAQDDGDDGNGNNGNNFLFNVVGGVFIDAEGVLSSTTPAQLSDASRELRNRVKNADSTISDQTELRMVSLKGLEEALRQSKESGVPLTEDVLFLAGLQRIQHVFLYPERNDIVLAGPGEGWVVTDAGAVVGESTGLPVLHLEDLLTAMRTSREAASGFGISCSIDPTQEGRVRLDRYLSNVRSISASTIRPTVDGMRQALGEQQITLTGVPTDSRFARVLVAADYQMKRLAMGLEESPINNFPSFLAMMQSRGGRGSMMTPRWWLATDYEPLGASEDGLSWELRGQGVQCMTEDEFITNTGEVVQTGRVNPMAQKWSDNMNERFTELSRAQPIFGDLRNIMDMAVIAALVEKEGMLATVGLDAPMIFSDENGLQFSSWPAPQTVDTQCSFARAGRNYIITASGGVQVDSWSVAENVVRDASVGQRRSSAPSKSEQSGWFWD